MTYITTLSSTSDLTTYDFGDVSVPSDGTLVVIPTARAGATRTFSSISIGGSGASIVARNDSGGVQTPAAIAVQNVSAGNRNVTVTFSAGMARCIAGVYLMTGHASNTPSDVSEIFNASATTSTGIDLDFPTDGYALYGIMVVVTGGTNIAWSAATEESDANYESLVRVAYAKKTTSGAGNTETASYQSGGVGIAAAVWAPAGGGGSGGAAAQQRMQQASVQKRDYDKFMAAIGLGSRDSLNLALAP